MEQKIGHYSFIGGVLIAVLLGLASGAFGIKVTIWLTSLMVVFGLIVGFINVTGKDTKEFMMVSTFLIIASFAGGASNTLGSVEVIGPFLEGIFNQVLAFIVPATVVVGLKDIWSLGQNPI